MKKWQITNNNFCYVGVSIIILLLLLTKASNANNVMGEYEASPMSYKECLPDWIDGEGYIGISDPISDTLSAYKQAVQRALAFYAIGNGMNYSSVYEYYYLVANMDEKKDDNQKSHWMAEFDVTSDGISYNVEKLYRTKYNETIVLLSISQGGDVNVKASGSFMYHYEYHNRKSEYGEKQIITMSSDDVVESLEWNSTISELKHLKKTTMNGVEKIVVNYSNPYEDFGAVTENMVFANTGFGLWNSYIDTFFQALSVFESKNVVIENTSRKIAAERTDVYEDKLQNMSRLVMKTKVSCILSDISLKNNNLYVAWEIAEK